MILATFKKINIFTEEIEFTPFFQFDNIDQAYIYALMIESKSNGAIEAETFIHSI
jgi:uncharacterized protein with HEPN domain